MIRAKRGWVYQVRCTRLPGVFGKSRHSKPSTSFGPNQVQKRFGQRTLRRNNESEKSCYHPNRLNLLTLTTGRAVCSNFLREIRD